ncbi:MAG: YfhO family protein [Prevotellaceae bacterium]|jgi:hypothetical protein|nr:YfhO family protein [Prevotellaceae bacterium]
MKKISINMIMPHVVAVVIFIAISFLYFSPEIFEGKTILGHDSRSGTGADIHRYRQETGENSRWSDAVFSGMPGYQINLHYDSSDTMLKIRGLLGLEFPVPVGYVFVMLLGFYIMLLIFGARTDVAILGSIGYAFSSYFFIIIGAGHIFKLLTLAYIPPTIAGIALAYKGRYWAGGIITALFLTLQILSNHVQMSYYFLFVIAAYVIYEFIKCLKNKELTKFVKASSILCIAGAIAVCINISNLYHTWEYGKETMRGKSELTTGTEKPTDGLDRDYMVRWSYGIGETWTLLIPNVKGGASGYLGNDASAMGKVDPMFRQNVAQQNAYWGNQPGTSGPVYAGAIFVLFFVMSIFLLRSKIKWAMLAVFIVTIALSWGQNFMWLTNLFADYFPMYSKFRAVSSILVVAEFIIPFMAILMLIEIIKTPEIIIKNKKKTYICFGITGGLALIFAIFPGLFSFLSDAESAAFYSQAQQNSQVLSFIDALENARKGIFQADALRTVAFIAGGGLILYLFIKRKIKSRFFIILLTVLCLFDMWSVNKRYLNKSSFIPKRNLENYASFFPKTAADIEILKDTDINYRVFNTTTDAFNESETSYYHKSVGGYHAAKLRRYQDLIDYYLSRGKEKAEVFNMLNTKYFIVANSEKKPIARLNRDALGNAWFVDSLIWINNANEEITTLGEINTATTAVIDKRFENILEDKKIEKDTMSNISLTEYNLNELKYKSSSAKDGFVVFSEIYYSPGWKATIDGKLADIVRVNYVLRGLYIPAGEHEIVFTFRPRTVGLTESIAFGGIIILMLSIVGCFVMVLKKKANFGEKIEKKQIKLSCLKTKNNSK